MSSAKRKNDSLMVFKREINGSVKSEKQNGERLEP